MTEQVSVLSSWLRSQPLILDGETPVLTLFKNHPKGLIQIFEFWHFPQFFVILKLTCLVTLFDRKLQVFKTSSKLTIFWLLTNFSPLKNVNVARLASNVKNLNFRAKNFYLSSCDCMRYTAWIKHGITATHGHAPLHPTVGRESTTKLGIVVNTEGFHAQKGPHQTGGFTFGLWCWCMIKMRFIMPAIVFSF